MMFFRKKHKKTPPLSRDFKQLKSTKGYFYDEKSGKIIGESRAGIWGLVFSIISLFLFLILFFILNLIFAAEATLYTGLEFKGDSLLAFAIYKTYLTVVNYWVFIGWLFLLPFILSLISLIQHKWTSHRMGAITFIICVVPTVMWVIAGALTLFALFLTNTG